MSLKRSVRKVLFVPGSYAYLREYRNIILELRRRGVSCVVNVTFTGYDLDSLKKELDAEWIFTIPDGRPPKAPPFLGGILHFRRELKRARELIERSRCDTLVIPAAGNVWRIAYYRAARALKLRVIMIPILWKPPGHGDRYATVDTSRDPLMKKIFHILFPSLFFHFDERFRPEKGLVRVQHKAWLAQYLLGNLPAHPYSGGLEKADKVCLTSEYIRDLLLSLPVSFKNLMVTGAARLDDLNITEEERIKRIRDLGLEPGSPIVLVNIPHYAEHNLWSWEDHWKFVERLYHSVKEVNAQLVFTFRPGLHDEDYARNAERIGFRLANRDLAYLVPTCDLFVTDASSSTSRFAIVCGRPVIGMHLHEFSWQLLSSYKESDGFTLLRDLSKMSTTVTQLLRDPTARGPRKSKIAFADGKASQRISDVIEGIAP